MKKKIIILLINILIYSIFDYRYIGLLMVEIIGTYYVSCCIRRTKDVVNKKRFLITGSLFVVIILAFFKYFNFFATMKNISFYLVMPLGISYYSFKMLSYMIDSYWGRIEYEVSLIDYAVYVSFFPQIMCGPISRADEIIEQLNNDCSITKEKVSIGIQRILSGMFKKFVIADRLAIYTTKVFNSPDSYPSIAAWIATFFFSIQIYCDFAGYSEMAIGVCNVIGFKCKPNFFFPYFSYSIKEFWKRWHISLSTWLKDYVYIPLGGNRRGRIHRTINIMLTFLISGIWHGNNLNFILWGIFHGICNIFSFKKPTNQVDRLLKTIITFMIVSFGWIIFNVYDMQSMIAFLKRMFIGLELSYDTIVSAVLPFTDDYSCLAYFLCVCFFIFMLFIFEWNDSKRIQENELVCNRVRNTFYLVSIVLFGCFGVSSFLYANF